MAKATAICTCKVCKSYFKKEKKCYNRKEANEWKSWAGSEEYGCYKKWNPL